MAFKIFRRLADLLDLDETNKTAGYSVVVNATADGYELSNVSGGGGGGAPTDATYITQTANASLSAEQALSSLATGVVKVTNGTGALSTATEGTDYYKPGGTDVAVADGGTGASTAAGARTNLGLGTIATQDSSNVAITGGAVSGITDLAVADGGTGASTAAGARTNLGVVIGTDVASQTSLDNHINDTSAAHAASAISADSTTLVGVGTDVQAVLEELDNGIADHLADTSAAHAASAISIADSGNYFTGTDVEAALQELGAAGGGGGGLFDAYAIISDTKAANTSGGNMASGAWTTHILNTEDSDPSGIVSISSNEFTLQAGSYNIVARATFVPPSNAICDVRIRIYNVTDSAVALIGENLLLYNAGGMAHLTGRLTLAAAKALRLEYRSDAARNTDGLGLAVNWGISEVFARVEIYREA